MQDAAVAGGFDSTGENSDVYEVSIILLDIISVFKYTLHCYVASISLHHSTGNARRPGIGQYINSGRKWNPKMMASIELVRNGNRHWTRDLRGLPLHYYLPEPWRPRTINQAILLVLITWCMNYSPFISGCRKGYYNIWRRGWICVPSKLHDTRSMITYF
jgi:hypothetical protein